MNRTLGIMFVALLLGVPPSTASAQLLPARDGAIVYGHHHVNASSLEEHKKFWADTLGGTVVTTKVAFVTDPWGTLIELSEGLRLIP